MITLAQHLAAHQATSKWVDCDGGCGWWAKHTGHPMPACTCGQVSRSDDPTAEHAAHVAATWQQARTITTIDQLDALPVETVVRELSRDGFVLEKYWDQVWDEARWLYPGDDDPQLFPSLPAIVLWRPEDGDQ